MDNLQRIKTTSRRIKKTCSVVIVCLPLLLALQWIFFPAIPIFRWLPFVYGWPEHLPGLTRFLAFLIEMIPLSVLLYVLLRIRELFRLYENGMIFTEKNVSCIRRPGSALIVWAVCDVIKISLLSLVFVMNNPPDQRLGVIHLDPAHFACIFIGIVVLIIAWVMEEAQKIQEDQTLFI